MARSNKLKVLLTFKDFMICIKCPIGPDLSVPHELI